MFGIVGIPIPDETLLVLAGYLVYKGQLLIIPTVATAFCGSICGITLSYGLGRTAGVSLIERYGCLLHISKEKIDRAHGWLARTEKWGLLIGYFIPGIRHLTGFAVGAANLKYSVFALFAYCGGLIWSCTFITLGYFGAQGWTQATGRVREALLIAAAIAICLILLSYCLARIGRSLKTE